MKLARMRRLLIAAGVGALALAPIALPAPAHAGQIGVTLTIQGAGRVVVVDGEPADGGSKVCDKSDNLSDQVGAECPRIRVESVFEAWVWMRPENTVDGFTFSRWENCDIERVVDGVTECNVRIGAFRSKEHYPVAKFVEARAVVDGVRWRQGPEQGRVTLDFDNTGPSATCTFDTTSWFPCASGSSWVRPEGEGGLWVVGINRSGTWSNPVVATYRSIDTDLHRVPPTLTNSRSASFGWVSRSGNGFDCSLDGAPFTACGPGQAGSTDLHELRDGAHTWRVRARHGDWVDQVPATHTWTVDTVAPVTAVASWSGTTEGYQATFSSTDAVRHECRVDGAAWAACESPVSLPRTGHGEHLFEVRGIDAAGNAATPVSRSWSVDAQAPDAVVTGGPAEGSFVLGSTARFTVGTRADDGGPTCTLDGRSLPCQAGTLSLTGLEPGTHRLVVGAEDLSDNVDATPATRTWTVPTTASSFRRRGAWRAVRTGSAYGGAALTTTTRGASLTQTVRGARRVALVVGSGRGHGTVRVYAGSRLVRTVTLAASRTSTRRVVPVASFGTPFTGTLKVVVTSSRKPVRVEGLGVSTR